MRLPGDLGYYADRVRLPLQSPDVCDQVGCRHTGDLTSQAGPQRARRVAPGDALRSGQPLDRAALRPVLCGRLDHIPWRADHSRDVQDVSMRHHHQGAIPHFPVETPKLACGIACAPSVRLGSVVHRPGNDIGDLRAAKPRIQQSGSDLAPSDADLAGAQRLRDTVFPHRMHPKNEGLLGHPDSLRLLGGRLPSSALYERTAFQ